jgi:diacylglycerol kinase
VKAAKDVAAGAVLVASIAAAIIGAMVFVPYARL